MKRLAVTVLAVGVVLGLAAVLAGRYAMPEPTYTVAQVAAGLRQQPAQWAGRSVLVRGVVTWATTMNMCTSADIRSSSFCTQQQSWMIDAAGAGQSGQWATPARVILHARQLGANGGFAQVKRAGNHAGLYVFFLAPRPAQELAVAGPRGARPPVGRARQILPDAAYMVPVVGPLAARLFPRDDGQVYRVRLLDPRICAQVTQPPCADAVFAP